jgi:hypothetical protein
VEIHIRAKIHPVNLAEGEKFAKRALEAVDGAIAGRWTDVEAVLFDDAGRRFSRIELSRQ